MLTGTQGGCWDRLPLWLCREQLTDLQARCCVLVSGLGGIAIAEPPQPELTLLPLAVDMY